jgi:hypothetical protein
MWVAVTLDKRKGNQMRVMVKNEGANPIRIRARGENLVLGAKVLMPGQADVFEDPTTAATIEEAVPEEVDVYKGA